MRPGASATEPGVDCAQGMFKILGLLTPRALRMGREERKGHRPADCEAAAGQLVSNTVRLNECKLVCASI